MTWTALLMRVVGLFGGARAQEDVDTSVSAVDSQPPVINTITCPHCSAAVRELMEYDACVIFLYCPACHSKIEMRPGDCCVFRSYGAASCPHPEFVGARSRPDNHSTSS